jgi:hypothetical protein
MTDLFWSVKSSLSSLVFNNNNNDNNNNDRSSRQTNQSHTVIVYSGSDESSSSVTTNTSSSSSSSEGDEKNSTILSEEAKLKLDLETVANHFRVNFKGLMDTYMIFSKLPLPVQQSNVSQWFSGLGEGGLVSQTSLRNHNIILNDSQCGELFYNVFYTKQATPVKWLSRELSDTFMVDVNFHDPFYYIISRALVKRLSEGLKRHTSMLLLINEMKKNIPWCLGKYHTSQCQCKNRNHRRREGVAEEELCLNHQVIYTKKTSFLYTFVKKMFKSTNMYSIKGNDEQTLKWNNCDLSLPLPFYLVLFLCGNVKEFRTPENLVSSSSLQVPEINNTTTTTTTSSLNTDINVLYDTYKDYEKWVCLPSWCLLLCSKQTIDEIDTSKIMSFDPFNK